MNYAIPTQLFTYLINLIDTTFATGDLSKYLAFLPIFLIGIIFSFLLTPIIGKIAWKYGITYKPKQKRNNKDFDNSQKALHDIETPALGGLAITIPAFLIMTLCFQLNAFTIPILLAFLILIIGSALDDILNLNSKIQLGYQILACLVIVVSAIDLLTIGVIGDTFLNLSEYTHSFEILGLHLSLALPGDIILFFWLMLCLNAVKWVGGSPALIESYSTVIFLLLFVIAIRTGSLFSSTISIIIVGSLLSFLFFAIPPQKIMSGSPAKSVFGFLMALLALISDAKLSTTIMILGLPLLDAIFVVVRRVVVHKPSSLGELMKINDATHFHHQLMKLNFSGKQILLIESSIAFLLGSIAIATTGALRYFVIIFGITLILFLIAFINYKANREEAQRKKDSPESKYSY
ncbi:hypothetical protein K8R20_00205 [bacterium]|nr:hypothetical protein [bacterium]